MFIPDLRWVRREALTRGVGTRGKIYLYVTAYHRVDMVKVIDHAVHAYPRSVDSIAGLANLVAELCSGGKRIQVLTISSHGNRAGQLIGRDWLDQSTLPNYATEFARIRNFLAFGAVVNLGGCLVGHAGGLLSDLSRMLGGATVKGHQASQTDLLPGHEGLETVCVQSSCTTRVPTLGDVITDTLE